MLKELTLAEARQLERAVDAADETCHMDEQTFRTLYERTARPLWSYLYRVSGNAALADDLVQESYYRILRARLPEMNQDYMKNYLFRIATNLMRDHWRRAKSDPVVDSTGSEQCAAHQVPSEERAEDTVRIRSDLGRVLETMKPRDRELLWLAYVEGSSHREIAVTVGLKEKSIRPMLFRARNRLASLLRAAGLDSR